jgi:hypothetical protein
MFDWTSVTGNSILNIDPFGSLAHPICLVHRENLEQLKALISQLEAISIQQEPPISSALCIRDIHRADAIPVIWHEMKPTQVVIPVEMVASMLCVSQ